MNRPSPEAIKSANTCVTGTVWNTFCAILCLSLALAFPRHAAGDLVLDISDDKVAPGGSGRLIVSVETTTDSVDLFAWETELVVDSNSDLIDFSSVELAVDEAINKTLSDFLSSIKVGGLQAGSFAPWEASPAVARLMAVDGKVPLYYVNYTVSPMARTDDVIVINFSANEFTNFLDESITPIPLIRSGGKVFVSAVPEPSSVVLLALANALAGVVCIARRVIRKSSSASR